MSEAMLVARIPRSLSFPDREKPYVESIQGRLEPKVSPQRRHGKLELRLGRVLEDWAGDRGEVAIEWRFYLLGDRPKPSSLVPDVAYVSFERLPRDLPDDARERPRTAPDIAVEILSPGDRRTTLEKKVKSYFAHGTLAVIVVRPQRNIEVRYPDGTRASAESGRLAVHGFPDLVIDVDALFSNL